VFLALGSNLGDRAALLARAVENLVSDPDIRVVSVSSLYSTQPVGLAGAPEFLNAALEALTYRTADSMLDLCLSIERKLGRVRIGALASRTLDIDILLFDDVRRQDARLTLPHPRLKDRAFALVPLAEIAPDLALDGRPIGSWAALADRHGVRRLAAQAGWPPDCLAGQNAPAEGRAIGR
jgi:2-amino-4-hydroxy-6-hydroxymethyldihydropteridine diphosphokinase